jgi:hypothetical protein
MTVNGGAAGAGGETVVDTDGAAGEGTRAVEAREEATAGTDGCADSGVELPADGALLPRPLTSAVPAAREVSPTLETTPSWCLPRVPDFTAGDPAPALPVEPDTEVLAPPDADVLDSGEPPDGAEPPDAVDPPDVGAVPVVSDVVAGAGFSCCSSVWPEPVSAKATIGLHAIAEPTPSATANAPIRPMFAA